MARLKGAKGRKIETVPFNMRMDAALRNRLYAEVGAQCITIFVEAAIKEKLDRDSIQLWAQREQALLLLSM